MFLLSVSKTNNHALSISININGLDIMRINTYCSTCNILSKPVKTADSYSSLRGCAYVWIFVLHVHVHNMSRIGWFTCSSFEATHVDLNWRFSWLRTRGENPLRAMSSARAVCWLQPSVPLSFLPSPSPGGGCRVLEQGKSGSEMGHWQHMAKAFYLKWYIRSHAMPFAHVLRWHIPALFNWSSVGKKLSRAASLDHIPEEL